MGFVIKKERKKKEINHYHHHCHTIHYKIRLCLVLLSYLSLI
jgi:hypothetical protein